MMYTYMCVRAYIIYVAIHLEFPNGFKPSDYNIVLSFVYDYHNVYIYVRI